MSLVSSTSCHGVYSGPEPAYALVRSKHRHHAKRACDLGDALPEHALADDAEPRAREIADRVIEEAELAGLPASDPQ